MGGGGGKEGTGVKCPSHPNRIINIMLSDFLNFQMFTLELKGHPTPNKWILLFPIIFANRCTS